MNELTQTRGHCRCYRIARAGSGCRQRLRAIGGVASEPGACEGAAVRAWLQQAEVRRRAMEDWKQPRGRQAVRCGGRAVWRWHLCGRGAVEVERGAGVGDGGKACGVWDYRAQ